MNIKICISALCVLFVALDMKAQIASVTNLLKAKYSLVEYHKDNGGWYLLGKQNGTNKEYGFCNKQGKVIAFGGNDYKIYESFIELYMLDPVLKKEHDEWKLKYDEWYKEKVAYDKVSGVYENKVRVLRENLVQGEFSVDSPPHLTTA